MAGASVQCVTWDNSEHVRKHHAERDGRLPPSGSNVWQWRVKAPKELRHLYPSGWACRCSLGTTDRRQANLQASRLRAEWLAKFATQRLALSPEAIQSVSEAATQFLAQRLLHDLLATDEELRIGGFTEALRSRGGMGAEHVAGFGNLGGMQAAMRHAVASHNEQVLMHSVGFRTALAAI